MDLTLALSPVEVDALQIAFPTLTPDAALHALVGPVIQKTSEARLQRLATQYRDLSPADQLEASTLLTKWRENKEAEAARLADPVADIPEQTR